MIEVIKKHRSIRKYQATNLSEQMLNEILEAGIRASTTGNMQLYSIIVTTNKELREQLWKLHFKQEMVLQAPVHLTFCADINRFHKWCDYRDANPAYDNFLWFINATIDAILVSQNIVLAAEEKGLGICYLGTVLYMSEEIIKLLDIPKGVMPVTALVIGYPAENPPLTDRLPLRAVVHHEKYHDYSKNDINMLYKEKEALESTKKLLIENKKENLAQVFTDNRYTKKDNIFFSNKVFQVLKQQGFFKQ